MSNYPAIKKNLFTALFIGLVFFGLVFLGSAELVSAQETYGLDQIAPTDLKRSELGNPSEIIGRVLGAALSLVGVIFFLLMLYGGIMWMTARGNEQKTGTALSTMVSAAIGLVIVLASYLLVSFLFKAVGATETSLACVNPLAGIGEKCKENADCPSSGTTCGASKVCVSTGDSLCAESCGSEFSCRPTSECDSDITLYYCTGGAGIVCCKGKK